MVSIPAEKTGGKMKSQFEYESKGDYLIFNIKGRYNRREFLTFPDVIKNRCEQENIYKVLINGLSVHGSNLSTTDRYFIGEKIGMVLQSRIKLAVVWPEKSIDKFAETVALNRGGNMRVLGSFDEAVEWLLASD